MTPTTSSSSGSFGNGFPSIGRMSAYMSFHFLLRVALNELLPVLGKLFSFCSDRCFVLRLLCKGVFSPSMSTFNSGTMSSVKRKGRPGDERGRDWEEILTLGARSYRAYIYEEYRRGINQNTFNFRKSECEWIPEVRCWCGEIAPVRMSWSYANPGKRFRACPRYGVRGNGNYRYFQWLDSDVSDRVAKVIRGLLKRLDKQDSEMQRIQAVIEEKNVKLKKNSLKYDVNGFAWFVKCHIL
nr:DNA-(apurinic or apyrimidinic site) lyase [Ipomoea batatas]